MKLLYHHRTMARDGQEIHIRALLRAFEDEGAQVREVALVPKGQHTSEDRPPSAGRSMLKRVTQLHPAFRELAEYLYVPIGRRRILTADSGFGADFLYERYAFGNAAGVLAARRLGIPLVLEVNSPLCQEIGATRGIYLRSLADRIERFVFRSADLVVAVSEALGQLIREWGVDERRLLVLHNGVRLEDYESVSTEDAKLKGLKSLGLDLSTSRNRPPVVGFVGYFRRWHQLDLLVRAMTLPNLSEIRVVLIGGGETSLEIEKLARELGVDQRLTLIASVPAREIPQLLPAFDIGIVPGIPPYASPLKMIEYMAAGLAVVAPDQPNIRELLVPGKSALLFAAGDGDDLGRALTEMVGDVELRRTLGRAARRVVEERNLSWRGNARRVLSCVDDLSETPGA